MPGFPVLEKLQKIRATIERLKWCRCPAENYKGDRLSSVMAFHESEHHLKAICLNTAICRETLVNQLTRILIYKRLVPLIEADPRTVKRPIGKGVQPVDLVIFWNDLVATSKDEVLALVDQAIALEEAENAVEA